jgi:alpha,alpha-trehalase
MLPLKCDDPAFVKALNNEPGILALAMDRKVDPVTNKVKLEALPFIVPGARFNEKYGWDSVRRPFDARLMTVLHGPGSPRRR